MAKQVDEEPPANEPQVDHLDAITMSMAIGSLTVWIAYSFARDWFADALHEAQTGNDDHSRRREIIFAVCFAEAYLVEWVRDDVLNRDFARLSDFFPRGETLGPTEKWKRVVKSLRNEGLITAVPDFGRTFWDEFTKLVKMRNGLIHARSSRPETKGQLSHEKPLPSMGDLDKLPAGWAARVAVEPVKELHAATATRLPDWVAASQYKFLYRCPEMVAEHRKQFPDRDSSRRKRDRPGPDA
ncbi:MAG: hypothetical protein ACREHD_13435 [Pirellulales bacterium]